MSMSNMADAYSTVLSTCSSHNSGNGRNCDVAYVESEAYATNTLESNMAITNGSN